MKVNAGVRSVMAEAKVGELYPIPKYTNNCTQQLKKSSQSHINAHMGTHILYIYIGGSYISYHQPQRIKQVPEHTKEEHSTKDGECKWRTSSFSVNQMK